MAELTSAMTKSAVELLSQLGQQEPNTAQRVNTMIQQLYTYGWDHDYVAAVVPNLLAALLLEKQSLKFSVDRLLENASLWTNAWFEFGKEIDQAILRHGQEQPRLRRGPICQECRREDCPLAGFGVGNLDLLRSMARIAESPAFLQLLRDRLLMEKYSAN